MANQTPITAELDDVASELQKLADKNPKVAALLSRTAACLDMVSNTLEASTEVEASTEEDDDTEEASKEARKAKRRAKQESPADDYPDGEFGPENEHQDSYTAKNYHKTPIGKDSVSKAIGKNVSEILSDLDFAQRGNARDKQTINVQSSRKASWPFADLTPETIGKMAASGRWDLVAKASKMARQAAEQEVDEDITGSSDDLSTAALGETGDEDSNPPIDKDQVGGDLQFYGTYPQGEGGGPDSGHHRSSSRNRLRKAADGKADLRVRDPKQLLNDEPGDNVERDQELGGLSGHGRDSSKTAGRTATVYRPTHVPKEFHAAWHGAAQHLANQGRLLTASGKVDYHAINSKYTQLLGAVGRVAAQVGGPKRNFQ